MHHLVFLSSLLLPQYLSKKPLLPRLDAASAARPVTRVSISHESLSVSQNHKMFIFQKPVHLSGHRSGSSHQCLVPVVPADTVSETRLENICKVPTWSRRRPASPPLEATTPGKEILETVDGYLSGIKALKKIGYNFLRYMS